MCKNSPPPGVDGHAAHTSDGTMTPMTPPSGIDPARNASEDEPYVDPVIEAYKKDVDRSLIAETMRLTVEQRFDNLMGLQQFALELRRAVKAAAPVAAAK